MPTSTTPGCRALIHVDDVPEVESALAEALHLRVLRRGPGRAGERGAALLLVDVDGFKDINDIRGAQLDPDSLLGRPGGEEFAVVVPACGAGDALVLGERLCAAARNTPVPGEGDALRITVSIGVAAFGTGPAVESATSQAR